MPEGWTATPETRAKLEELTRRRGLRLLLAFGSQVTGLTHPASDLDLAVLLDAPEATNWLDLMADLQAVFPERTVDVVWLQRADPLIAWHALRRPRLLAGDPGVLARYQAYAWRRFVDYAPFFTREADAVRRSIARWRDGDR